MPEQTPPSESVPDVVATLLGEVLHPDAHADWWTQPMSKFAGHSPAQVWKRDPDEVLGLLHSYQDPSFS